MPRYQPGFSEEDYERLKEAIRRVGQDGPFSANDALEQVLNAGVPVTGLIERNHRIGSAVHHGT
jgi:hypothetical protein